MDSVAQNKRSRESYNDETITILEEAWQTGLKSNKEKEKIRGLGLKTNLPVEKIEVWIGNRRAKDRRGGVAPVYSKKKAAVRGPSSYTLFSQQFKREASSKQEYFKYVGKKWGELSQEEKLKFKDDARGIRSSKLKGMSAEEAIAHHFKQIENSINVLGSLGFEVMMVALKEHETPHLLGTNKGLEYIGQPQVLEPFRKSVFGNTVYMKQPSKKEKDNIRTEVRQVLNSCWEKATGELKAIPYSSLLMGKISWKLERLPVPVKEPSNYGIGDLQKILDKKAEIKFVKTQASLSKPGSAEEIVDSIVSNELALETVHDLSDGANSPTEEPAGPEISLELVDDMSTLLGLKKDEESAIISLCEQSSGKLENKNSTKQKRTVTNDTKGKKDSQTKKRKSSLGKKASTEFEIDDREGEGGREFLVNWKGYSEFERT